MSEQSEFALPDEIEGALQAIFHRNLPDQSFVDRLGHQLSDLMDQSRQQPHKYKTSISILRWGAVAIILTLFLIWGIRNLIPRSIPAAIQTPLATETATPTPIILSSNTPDSDVKYKVLSEGDMNCDGAIERVQGVVSPEVEYFDISPQLSTIVWETSKDLGFNKVWEETAQDQGVSYLAYQLFKADACNQFLVVIGHIGKDSLNVLRWDGKQVSSVLRLSGQFLFEGKWMEETFGDYKISGNTLYLGELLHSNDSSKNIWILKGYQWVDERMIPVVEKQIEVNSGG